MNVSGDGSSDKVISLVVDQEQDLSDLSTQLKQRLHTDRQKAESKPKRVPIEKYKRYMVNIVICGSGA